MKKQNKKILSGIILFTICILVAVFVAKRFFINNNINENIETVEIQNNILDEKNDAINDQDNIINIQETNKTEDNNSKELNDSNTSNDIFADYYDEAEKLMESMSLEEKVGQMFLARYPGATSAISEIKSDCPGGYVLFGVDFKNKTRNQVISELAADQQNSKINLLLAVDEEGGTVTRVSSYTNFRASKFKSPQEVYKQGGLEAIKNDSKEKSELLKSLGLNMNLAPVVDIPTNSDSVPLP